MLNWQRFSQLAGDDTANFENLCRGIVRRQFGYLGALKELKNQPGVEYHIELNQTNSKLGKAGQTVGWQCKWFQYKANGEFTTSAKAQVEHSLQKTKEHLSSLDVWILWTHKTLAKADQAWFYNLEKDYSFKLHLWNGEDLNSLLSGSAIDLRHSYFGELALTPDMLEKQHTISVAPIKKRWLHDVHQKTDVEKTTRRILGEPSAWESFDNIAGELTWASQSISEALGSETYKLWIKELDAFNNKCRNLVSSVELFKNTISGEQISYVKELLDELDQDSNQPISKVLRLLRRKNLQLSLVLTNALASLNYARKKLAKAVELFSYQLIAVVADAGGGKTQFSAELTSATEVRPAGILLLGRDLKSNSTLDDLAKRISFYSSPVENFEQLIIALDALGERSGCRLPIVIDGLNEAEDPREWKSLLASAEVQLKKYLNVVLICTLRTGERKRNNSVRLAKKNNSREDFAHKGLPDDCFIIESTGFSEKVTSHAIAAYFEHYKIKANPFIAPRKFFRHPLNLKIFCEVTNREAKEFVTVTHFPSSIYGLFNAQVEHIAETVSNMTNLSIAYSFSDIEDAIYFLGETIWKEGRRSVSETEFLTRFKINASDWGSNIINLLSQEGLLFRDEAGRREFKLTPAYDRMGGYFVAYYLLQKNYNNDHNDWLNDDDFRKKLFGEGIVQHELSQDILYALVVIFPKYNKNNLWECVCEEIRDSVVEISHLIDANDIDNKTREAFKKQVLDNGLSRSEIDKLGDLKTVIDHPFNAEFFDEILALMSMPDRDLSWTEYVRQQSDNIIEALNLHIKRWCSSSIKNDEVDKLWAVSITWLLASSSIELRDKATEALFYFGLHYPESLFKFTSDKLTFNDPYVIERMLGASYGVVGTLLRKGSCCNEITQFSKVIFNRIFSTDADVQMEHLFTREYASRIVQLTHKYIGSTFTHDQVAMSSNPFSSMPYINWGKMDDSNLSAGESPFRMDFENYTIGRLVRERGNYDYEHPAYQDARAKILWRVHDLGWSGNKFKDVESRVGTGRYNSRGERAKVERYGKKYSWIAYYELAGEFDRTGKLQKWHKRFDVDIDPFFPKPVKVGIKIDSSNLGNSSMSTDDWISNEEVPSIEKLNIQDESTGKITSWVLLKSSVTEESKRLDRHYFCFINMFFFKKMDRKKLALYFAEKKKVDWPDQQQTTYVYSGEIYENILDDIVVDQPLQVTIGSEFNEVEYPEVSFDESELSIGKVKKRLVEQSVYEDILIRYPLIEYYWEFNDSESLRASRDLLAPWLVEKLSLDFDASTLNYIDEYGEVATILINEIGEESNNNQELFYLREDLFHKALDQEDLSAGYNTYGERRLAQFERLNSDKKTTTYKEFRNTILSFK